MLWSSAQSPLPTHTIRAFVLISGPLLRPWIFSPWSRTTRPSLSRLWRKGGMSAEIGRGLRGDLLLRLRSGSSAVHRDLSTRATEGWADGPRPRASGLYSHASPKRKKVAVSTAALYLDCKTLLPRGEQKKGSFHPSSICCLVERWGCGRKGGNSLWSLLAPGPTKSEPHFSVSWEGGIN